ncbi:hypothetical protein EON81_28065 [bacterium]|nr:MAG: hypothetical protein EON81_28065 [bacterium]
MRLAKDLDLGLNSLQIDTDTPGSIKYTVVAQNKDGKRVKQSFTIDVVDPSQASIVDFTVSPKEVEANASVTIRWSVTGAAAVRLEYAGQAQDLTAQSGTVEVPVTAKTTFTLRAVDARGKAVTKSGTVTVKAPPEPPVLPEDGVDPTNATNETTNDPASSANTP